MINSNNPSTPVSLWTRFYSAFLRAYHAYAGWLVSISWWRFFAMSLLLLVAMGILHDIPPFSWTYTELLNESEMPRAPAKRKPASKPSKEQKSPVDGIDISIDERGVHINTRSAKPAASASAALPALPAAPASASASAPVVPAVPATPDANGVTIKLPPGVDAQAIKEAVDEARREMMDALEEAKQEAADAAEAAADEWRPRVIRHRYGDPLMPMTMWFILLSIIIKISYKGKVQAEAKAAQATEVAESESLKRQVVEARMAAMQAQVEPHFLFNTLASIEHPVSYTHLTLPTIYSV